MRDRFDMAIVDAARAAGAEVRDGATLGIEEARFVIAADGVRSPTRAMLGLPDVERGAAIEAELDGRADDAVHFDFGRIPYGYAWTFPKRAHLSVGILSYKPAGLKRAFDEYRRGLGDGPHHGWEIPSGGASDGPFHTDRGLVCGDAAGLVDPFTGEGIYYAVRSGLIAAEVVASGAPLAEYTRRINDEIVSELRVARRLADFFYGHPRLAYILGVRSRRANEIMMDALEGKRSYADARTALKRWFG